MIPNTRGQRGGAADLLLASGAAGRDGKAQPIGIAILRRHEHVGRGVVAEIKNASPVGRRSEPHPRFNGEIRQRADNPRRQTDILLRVRRQDQQPARETAAVGQRAGPHGTAHGVRRVGGAVRFAETITMQQRRRRNRAEGPDRADIGVGADDFIHAPVIGGPSSQRRIEIGDGRGSQELRRRRRGLRDGV